jgi:hypothetical protein
VDAWASFDHPQRLFPLGIKEFLYPPLSIWTGPDRFKEFWVAGHGNKERANWEKEIDPAIGFRVLDLGAIQDVDDPEKFRAATTLACVVEKVVYLGGRDIRVIGADMAGPWIQEHETEAGCIEAEGFDRWRHERASLEAQVEKAAEIGIKIELIKP